MTVNEKNEYRSTPYPPLVRVAFYQLEPLIYMIKRIRSMQVKICGNWLIYLANAQPIRKRTLKYETSERFQGSHSKVPKDNEYLKRFTLPKPTIDESGKLRNYDVGKQRRGLVEENKVGRVIQGNNRAAPDPTASCIKRMSDHPRARLRKMWSKGGNECRKSALEFWKRRQVLKNFALKNMQLAKPIWIEILAESIREDISFVDYVPEDHSYKVKPAYVNLVKELISTKLWRIGMAEKLIEVPHMYVVTSLSLQNFLVNNYYNQEIIDALLALYGEHAMTNGYLLWNTFSYHSVWTFLNNPNKSPDCSIMMGNFKKCKGIIFPIPITDPINEVIMVMVSPNEKVAVLKHYNSSEFSNQISKQSNKILNNIIEYVETNIMCPLENQVERDTAEAVSPPIFILS